MSTNNFIRPDGLQIYVIRDKQGTLIVAEMNRTMNRAIERLLSTLPTTSITSKETNVSQGNKEYKK